MAVDRRVEPGGAAAMVAVGVAEDDPADAAEANRGGADRAGHVARTRVEDGHAALVLDQVDVARAGIPPRSSQTPAAIAFGSAP